MKTTISFITFYLLFSLGCSDRSKSEKRSPQATLPSEVITQANLGPSLSVSEARNHSTSREIVVEGFIGGMKKPFSQSRAIFVLCDDSLETCDEIPEDPCPTPWDACCEDPKKITSSTISIQVLDNNGSLLSGTLEGVAGMEAGKRIKVKGIIDEKSTSHAMLLNAQVLQLQNN